MNKIISILLFGLLTMNVAVFAKDRIAPVAHSQEYYEMNAMDENFEVSDTSQYLTDEQMQDAQEIDNIEDNSGFWAKIINSSHFSPNTATKTYIPINKVGK